MSEAQAHPPLRGRAPDTAHTELWCPWDCPHSCGHPGLLGGGGPVGLWGVSQLDGAGLTRRNFRSGSSMDLPVSQETRSDPHPGSARPASGGSSTPKDNPTAFSADPMLRAGCRPQSPPRSLDLRNTWGLSKQLGAETGVSLMPQQEACPLCTAPLRAGPRGVLGPRPACAGPPALSAAPAGLGGRGGPWWSPRPPSEAPVLWLCGGRTHLVR